MTKYIKHYKDFTVNEASKFTFKTEKPKGKYKSFDEDCHYIKLNGHEVGTIDAKSPFLIRLQVMKTDTITDNNPNCAWKYITLAKESESLDDAKKFLNDNINTITSKFTIKTED